MNRLNLSQESVNLAKQELQHFWLFRYQKRKVFVILMSYDEKLKIVISLYNDIDYVNVGMGCLQFLGNIL